MSELINKNILFDHLFFRNFQKFMINKDFGKFKHDFPTLFKVINTTFDEISNLSNNQNVILKPLHEMSIEHFHEIFCSSGTKYGIEYTTKKILSFNTMVGFYQAIQSIGDFDSYEKAKELGYDVQFKLTRNVGK